MNIDHYNERSAVIIVGLGVLIVALAVFGLIGCQQTHDRLIEGQRLARTAAPIVAALPVPGAPVAAAAIMTLGEVAGGIAGLLVVLGLAHVKRRGDQAHKRIDKRKAEIRETRV